MRSGQAIKDARGAMPITHLHIRDRFSSLARTGLAVQRHARYHSGDAPSLISHDVLYLSCLLAGRASHDIGDERIDEGAGSLAVVHYHVPHRLITGAQAIDVVNVFLDPERHPLPVPSDLHTELHAFLPLHGALSTRRTRLLSIRFSALDAVRPLLLALCEEQDAARPGHELAMDGLLRQFLVAIGREIQTSGIRSCDEEPLITEIHRFLAAHCDQPIRLEELASRFHMSRNHLSRQFKRATGLTIGQQLLQLRLQRACQLLHDPDRSVLAVALACGWQDASHFSRQFHRTLGCTPGAYRKRMA